MNTKLLPEQSLADLCKVVAELTDGEIKKQQGVTTYASKVAGFSWYNRSFIEEADAQGAETAVQTAIDAGVPFVCYTEEAVEADLKEALTATGLIPLERQTGMVYQIGKMQKVEADTHIERIQEADLVEWAKAAQTAFGKPEEAAMPVLLSCEDCIFYAYRLDGKIVGTTLLYLAGENAGIHEVAVLQEYRGKGIAKALVKLALSDAEKKGASTVSLQASELGEPLYTSMGFEKVSTVCTWLRKL